MQIRLTLPALEKLIELDPGFEVTICQGVVEAFMRKHYIKALEHAPQMAALRNEARNLATQYVDEAIRERDSDRAAVDAVRQNETRIRVAAREALNRALKETLDESISHWSQLVFSEIKRAVNHQIEVQVKTAVQDVMKQVIKQIVAELDVAHKATSEP